jgi:putative aldouronate transport system permease protein
MKTRTWSGTAFDLINTLVMIIIIIFTFYPFLYIINYSLSDPGLLTGGLLLYPKGLNFTSYAVALSDSAILDGIFISIARTIAGPVLMIMITSMAAYCLTRDELMGVRFFRKFFVLTMYFSSGLIPFYILVKTLGMTGTFWIYVIPGAVSVFNMILIKTYIEALPKSMEEAAVIDGANDFKLYWQVIFPICTPVIAAVVLFSAVDQWNSFFDTQIFNAMHPELFTLQYVLQQTLAGATTLEQVKDVSHQMQATPQTLKMAITMITVLPILAVYPILQRHFTKGLLIGAIKG